MEYYSNVNFSYCKTSKGEKTDFGSKKTRNERRQDSNMRSNKSGSQFKFFFVHEQMLIAWVVNQPDRK